jgi:hypothetical protein
MITGWSGLRRSHKHTDGSLVVAIIDKMELASCYYFSNDFKIHAALSSKSSLNFQRVIAWALYALNCHRAGAFMRVRTIQLGAVALGSPMSIQPDRRVMIIGASSDCLVAVCA